MKPTPSTIPCRPSLLFEDASMLVLAKPAGWSVSGVADGVDGSELLAFARREYGAGWKAAHRIDPEIAGPVVFAREKAALDFLSGEFQSRMARGTWSALAVVARPEELPHPGKFLRDADGDVPGEFELDWPLKPDPRRDGVWCPGRRPEGRPAQTSVRVRARFGRYIWVECESALTLPHQVRVHLAAAGLPVLNDDLYGLPGERLLLSRLKRAYKGRAQEQALIRGLALQLAELALRHPLTREPVRVRMPLGKPFEVALRNLRKFCVCG